MYKYSYNQNIVFLFLFFCFLIFSSNNCSEESNSENTSLCKTTGIIRDLSGLDGCTFLIELDNGDRLLPADIAISNFSMEDFKEGIKVKFSYEELKDMVSICMAEKSIVRITCLEIL